MREPPSGRKRGGPAVKAQRREERSCNGLFFKVRPVRSLATLHELPEIHMKTTNTQIRTGGILSNSIRPAV